MQPAPKFPNLPTDLDKRDPKEQQRIIGDFVLKAADAYTTVRLRFEKLVDYINTETCHGE
jgi:hypothetical protein